MTLTTVDEADFDRDVTASDVPVFVKFGATWCAPCRAVAPLIASMAREYHGEMKFVEVDIDVAPGLAAQHGVRGVPTFLIFRDGSVVVRETGAQSRTRLAEMIDTALDGRAI